MKKFTKAFTTSALFLVILWAGSTAYPATLNLTGVSDPNNAVMVDFSYVPGTGIIYIDIKNISERLSELYDPRVTAFAFNVPEEVTGASFIGPSGWGYIFELDNIDTPGQFGFFDIAGVTGKDFNGGDPNDGIAIDQMFSFVFALEGSGLNNLTEDDFLNKLSYDDPGQPNESEQVFIARFQRTGLDGEGSDVAVVPEPATMLLFGSGLIGLAVVGRKKFRKNNNS